MVDSAVIETERTDVPGQGIPTYGYYRQPDGFITVSPATETEELVYRKRGWEPLSQYGRVLMASAYAADHPLEALFQFGGAKELCVDQIVQQALHIHPPIVPVCGQRLGDRHKRHAKSCWNGAKPVEFPQLENPPPALHCRFCDRDDLPTKEAQAQHETVVHKDEKGEIRMGEALASALTEGLQGSGTARSAEHPYVCGFCNAGFDNLTTFGKHVQEEQANG